MASLDILFGLYAKFKGLNNKQAFKELLEKECFDIDRSKFIIDTNNEIADINKRNEVYMDFLSQLKLRPEHKQLLLNYGFPKVYINKQIFKSIPSKPRDMQEIVKRKMFMRYMSSKFTLSRYSWLLST